MTGSFGGEFELRVEVLNSSGNSLSPARTDSVKIKVAPLILLPGTAPAEVIYLSDVDGDFVTGLKNAVGSSRVVEIPYTGVPAYPDRWVQDEFELGYTSKPSSVLPYVWDLPRNRGLDGWPEDTLRGPDYGHGEWSGTIGSYNYGGNIEVTPPYTLGGTEYRFGRAVAGTTMAYNGFLNLQVQGPVIQLDVSWLAVGHVDEVMTFVPDDGGFKTLIASTTVATNLLDAMNIEDSGTATGTGTSTTLVDLNQSWTSGEWTGGFIVITDGTGSEQVRQVTGNTSTSVSVARAWTTVPTVGWEYELVARSAYRALFFESDEDLGAVSNAYNDVNGTGVGFLVDSTKSWTSNKWKHQYDSDIQNDAYVRIVEGKGAGQVMAIHSSTGNTLKLIQNWTTVPDQTSRYVVVEKSKAWGALKGALRVVRELVLDGDFLQYQEDQQENIDAGVIPPLSEALGFTVPSDYIEIPVLFTDENEFLGLGYTRA